MAMFTPNWPRAGPTGGAGVALAAILIVIVIRRLIIMIIITMIQIVVNCSKL